MWSRTQKKPLVFFVPSVLTGGGHSPPKATGHTPGPGREESPEEEALAAKIQEHQQGAARLSHTEGERKKKNVRGAVR